MIPAQIFNFIIDIVDYLFQMIYGDISPIDVLTTYINIIGTIFTICTQAMNFIAFLLGDYWEIIITAGLILIPFKYIIAPLARLIIRLMPFLGGAKTEK